jgi:hypothetical protein
MSSKISKKQYERRQKEKQEKAELQKIEIDNKAEELKIAVRNKQYMVDIADYNNMLDCIYRDKSFTYEEHRAQIEIMKKNPILNPDTAEFNREELKKELLMRDIYWRQNYNKIFLPSPPGGMKIEANMFMPSPPGGMEIEVNI